MLEIGKIPNSVLQKLVLDKIQSNRKDVLVRPKIGEDCCAVEFGDYLCVLSTDPITGTAAEIGRLAVHISCNDIASCGVEPIGMLVTILAPQGSTEEEIGLLMSQLSDTANQLNVEIIGGHTEVTAAVNRFVVISTAVGKTIKNELVSTSGAKTGDFVIMTKTAASEGTAILAHEKEKLLKEKFGQTFVENSKAFINYISVVKEGIIAGKFGVSAMHDATEGGILGASWEVAEASSKGIELYLKNIPIAEETIKICNLLNIEPLKLISSGSMIITTSAGEDLVKEMESNGIKATIIGKITQNPNERFIVINGEKHTLGQPDRDELYKVV